MGLAGRQGHCQPWRPVLVSLWWAWARSLRKPARGHRDGGGTQRFCTSGLARAAEESGLACGARPGSPVPGRASDRLSLA